MYAQSIGKHLHCVPSISRLRHDQCGGPISKAAGGPVYRAIADAIDEDVQKGSLRAWSEASTPSDMADHLGVTVTTITRAYTEAARPRPHPGLRRPRHVHPAVSRLTIVRAEPEST